MNGRPPWASGGGLGIPSPAAREWYACGERVDLRKWRVEPDTEKMWLLDCLMSVMLEWWRCLGSVRVLTPRGSPGTVDEGPSLFTARLA